MMFGVGFEFSGTGSGLRTQEMAWRDLVPDYFLTVQ